MKKKFNLEKSQLFEGFYCNARIEVLAKEFAAGMVGITIQLEDGQEFQPSVEHFAELKCDGEVSGGKILTRAFPIVAKLSVPAGPNLVKIRL